MHAALSKRRTVRPSEINNSCECLGVRTDSQPHKRYPSPGGRTAKTKEPKSAKVQLCVKRDSAFPRSTSTPPTCPCKMLQQWSPLHFICLQTDCHGGNLTGGWNQNGLKSGETKSNCKSHGFRNETGNDEWVMWDTALKEASLRLWRCGGLLYEKKRDGGGWKGHCVQSLGLLSPVLRTHTLEEETDTKSCQWTYTHTQTQYTDRKFLKKNVGSQWRSVIKYMHIPHST